MRISLDAIAFDAGTQIREAIDLRVVSDYAEAMTGGATFPPVILFHDGNRYYLADGFHRFMAAQRNQFRDIAADVKPGTKEDALWFALGANRANGKRLSDGDKKHAILLALQAWPEKSANMIAEQVGCQRRYVDQLKIQVGSATNLPDRVTGKDGKSYPASKKLPQDKINEVERLLQSDVSVYEIRDRLNIATTTIRKIREAAGISRRHPDTSQRAVSLRLARMAQMAEEGFSSRQIAQELGVSLEGCRNTLRERGIEVPADRVIGSTKHHDANRIVGRIVMDAQILTDGVELIDFSSLDREQIGPWTDVLVEAQRSLGVFIKRLLKEKQNGQAA